MKYVMFLYTGSDSEKAEELRDYLQGKLRNFADLRSITESSAEERDFRKELRARGDCVVLIGSHHASALIRNKLQEAEDDFLTFDGKVINEELTENKDLVDRLIIVFFDDKTMNDWIPAGFDERKTFQLKGEKIRRGNPILDQLEFFIKCTLDGKTRVEQMLMP